VEKALEYDIAVAGGGSAGSAAAIAAARRGMKVLLVEEANCLGGISTAGGVGEWFANVEGTGSILADVKAGLEESGSLQGRLFNPEHLKIIWQILAEKAGVEVLLDASVIGAAKEGKRLEEIEIAACAKRLKVKARHFIDATGEGDLGALAGAEFMKGEPGTGRTLHMTLVFSLWNTGRPVKPWLPEGLAPIRDESELPGLHGFVKLEDGRVYCNATKVLNHDPTDPFSLSSAEMEARRQLARVLHYLQTHGFESYELASSASKIGIREGRRLLGDFVLREEHILGEKPRDFEDGVAVATSQIDFHSLSQQGHAGWRRKVAPYAIPFRCLQVKGIANLLSAGKCISADQVVHSSSRMTPTCCATGQAAGTAAALAVEAGLQDTREIDLASLRKALSEDGMELNPAKHSSFHLKEPGEHEREASL